MWRYVLLALPLLSLLASPAVATPYGPVFVTSVTDIYDGDTFRVDVAEWPPVIGDNMPVRVRGINTPELRSRCDTEAAKEAERERARQARAYATELLQQAETIVLDNIERGTFFRLVADVSLDGEDFGAKLTEAGYAKPFETGTSGQAWCDP